MDIVWNDDEYTEAAAMVERAELDDDDILMPLMEVDVIAVPRGFGTGSRPGKAPYVNPHRLRQYQ